MGALEDDLTEHHRMRTIEDLRKEFLEIEALRKELAEAKNLATYDYMNGQAELSAVRKELAEAYRLRDFHHNDAINSRLELEAANASLAETKAALEVYDRTFPKKSELELHAALEAAKARIATLEAIDENCARCCCAELKAANARIAELAAQNKHMYGVLLDAEDLLGVEETGELITRPIGRLIARAERAEARIAELEQLIYSAQNELGRLSDSRALLSASLDEECARAERAEAEVKAMREALEKIERVPKVGETNAWQIARAALNPSPADPSGDTPRRCPSE